MILSEKLIREYQKEHERKFGEAIPSKEAERELLKLAGLVRLITKTRKARNGR